jgi:DHA1 family inner membrane transport protein
VVLLVFVFTAHSQTPAATTIAVFGAARFATVAAFNLRTAGGAWLGGMAIDHGLGYTAPTGSAPHWRHPGLVVAIISAGPP